MNGRTITDEIWSKFLDLLRQNGNVTLSARELGFDRRTAYHHRDKDPAFREAFDNAIEEATDLQIEEARRRGVDGVSKPVFYKGDICGYIQEYSDSLLQMLIRARRPEFATERREITGRDGQPLGIVGLTASDLSDDQLAAIIGAEEEYEF